MANATMTQTSVPATVPTDYEGSEEREARIEAAVISGVNPEASDLYMCSAMFYHQSGRESWAKAPITDSVGDAEFGRTLHAYNKAGHRVTYDMLRALSVEARTAFFTSTEVGEGVTYTMYTDRQAYTVISKTKSGKTFTCQQDKATIDPDWRPEIVPGGFSGHCTNQETQTYTYEADPEGHVMTARVGRDGWLRWTGQKRPAMLGRRAFRDYNF